MAEPLCPTAGLPLALARSIIYDRPLVQLHHYWLSAYRRKGDPDVLEPAAIAGLEKTARRFYALLDSQPWFHPTIVDVPSPEAILFTGDRKTNFVLSISATRRLQQQEQLLPLGGPGGDVLFLRAGWPPRSLAAAVAV